MKRLLGSNGWCVCYVPGCGTTLRAGQFQEQVFEDTGVQTEVAIRKRIVSEYVASMSKDTGCARHPAFLGRLRPKALLLSP